MIIKPPWFHDSGEGRLLPLQVNRRKESLQIVDRIDGNGSIQIAIRRLRRRHRGEFRYRIEWKLARAWGKMSGKMSVLPSDLSAMFALTADDADTSFHRSQYNREDEYLTIPGGDAGGDLHLSVFVTLEIQNAVRELLALLPFPCKDS